MNNKKSNKIENQKHIVEYLIRKFNQNSRPNKEVLHKIASKTKISYQKILKWFLDERFKRNKAHYSHPNHYPIETTKFLLEKYEKQRYPSSDMLRIYANKISLTFKKVQMWFKGRRFNEKKFKRNDRIMFDKGILYILNLINFY